MFRRRRKSNDPAEAVAAELRASDGETDAGPTDADTGSTGTGAVPGRVAGATPADDGPHGPFDVSAAPDDGVPRVDLGALQVPMVDGVEFRLEVDEQGQLGQILLVDGASMMQLGAFAAPRSSGIWDEVRAEIVTSVTGAGGQAEEVEGRYGIELAAQVPTGTPGELAPARFLGVDRPRWFLRALLSGPAAQDEAAATRLEAALDGTVVARGGEAMPIRDPLPLKLPKEAVEAAEAADAEALAQEQSEPDLDQLGPGPTMTESR